MRTLSRIFGAWVLGLGLLLIAVQGAAATPARTILVLGDSLSAAYGIKAEQGWVSLLQKRLQGEGYGYKVVNASVSGETTSGGLQRLPRALELHRPEIVILELGGNDGLRGLPVSATRANLEKMTELARQAGAQVLLVGIQIPPNYGPRYGKQFAQVFPQIAERHELPFVPFLLEGVALDQGLMQDDGIHPNEKAQPRMVEMVWSELLPLLKK